MLDVGLLYMVLMALTLGLLVHGQARSSDTPIIADDLLVRCARADLRVHRSGDPAKDARRRIVGRVDGTSTAAELGRSLDAIAVAPWTEEHAAGWWQSN